MARRLSQNQFAAATFSGSNINLHAHPNKADELVLFVHGLGGSGYSTWGRFPEFMFDAEPGFDVAVCNYRSFYRRWRVGRSASLSRVVDYLADALRDFGKEYQAVYAIGHSLGGILLQDAAKRHIEQTQALHVIPLAALVMMGTPSAGSGWAFRGSHGISRDLRVLRRLNPDLAAIEEFWASPRIEERNVFHLQGAQVFLPRFACSAEQDKFVSRFSARVGIPTENRTQLPGTHTSVVKIASREDEAITHVRRVIDEVHEARLQWMREEKSRLSREPRKDRHPIRGLLWGAEEPVWEAAYHDACDKFASGVIAATTEADADLLINLCAAEHALSDGQHQEAAKARTLRAHAPETIPAGSVVGTSAVGPRSPEAAQTIRTWLAAAAPKTLYVEPSRSPSELEHHIQSWLEIVVRRRGRTPSIGHATADELMLDRSDFGGDF